VTSGRRFVDARASQTTRVEPRHRSRDTAFIQDRGPRRQVFVCGVEENQLVQRGRIDFLKELRPLLLIGFSVSLGGVE
jgi:hypothetical protein